MPQPEPQPIPQPMPVPQPMPQPVPQPQPTPQPQPVEQPGPWPTPQPIPEPQLAPAPAPGPWPTPQPAPEQAPWPTPQPPEQAPPETGGLDEDGRFVRQFVQTGPLPEPAPVPEDVPIAQPQQEPEGWWPQEQAAQPPAEPHDMTTPTGASAIVFADGQTWPVDEPLLVGRVPQAYPGEEARLVRVASPHHDISRTHVRIELYDGAVWATDRDSTNGTVIHNPGQEPITARPNQPVHVWLGGVIDIGDGMTIRVD